MARPSGYLRTWLNLGRTPTPAEPPTAYMNFFLNTETSCSERAGQRIMTSAWRKPHLCRSEHDLVAVVRWIDNKAADGFVQRLLASGGAAIVSDTEAQKSRVSICAYAGVVYCPRPATDSDNPRHKTPRCSCAGGCVSCSKRMTTGRDRLPPGCRSGVPFFVRQI